VLNTDKNPADPAAVEALKGDGSIPKNKARWGRLFVPIASELPDHLATAMALGRKTGQRLWQAEHEIYGVMHAEVGAYLLGLWGLPYPLVEAVANHHMPKRVQHPGLDALTAVHVANALAHECEPGGKPESQADLNSDYAASLGLAHHLPQWRALSNWRVQRR
jgi:HD-like signal output (HDOD) protein